MHFYFLSRAMMPTLKFPCGLLETSAQLSRAALSLDQQKRSPGLQGSDSCIVAWLRIVIPLIPLKYIDRYVNPCKTTPSTLQAVSFGVLLILASFVLSTLFHLCGSTSTDRVILGHARQYSSTSASSSIAS